MPDPSTNMVDAQNFALSMQTERGFQNGYSALGFEEARRVRDSAHTDEELAEGFGHIAERIADSAGVLGVQAEKLGAATSIAIEKVGNQGRTDALTFANQAAVERLTHFNSLSVQAEKLGAAAQLEAEKNRNALATQMAECCCEVKELIRAENGATRDLINNNTIQALRDQVLAQNASILKLLPVTVIP